MTSTLSYAKQAFLGEDPATSLRLGRRVAHCYANVGVTGTVGGTVFSVPYFEIPVGCKAIAIGPSSQVGQVVVLWTPPGGSEEIVLFLDSRHPLMLDLTVNPHRTTTTALIPGVVSPAVIRIVPFALYDHLDMYVATGGAGPSFVTVLMELLLYFDTPTTLPSGRADGGESRVKTLTGATDQAIFNVPALGRNKLTFVLANLSSTATLTWRLSGYSHLFDGTLGMVANEHHISPAVGAADNTVAALGTASYVLQGARFQEYRLVITGTNGEKMLYRYTVSD
jgi:hypothetical protein